MSAVVFGTGSIVLGLVGVYPKDALVVDGYDTPGNLVVHPMSGGFPYKLEPRKASLLREVIPTIITQGIFRKATFTLEGAVGSYAGWTDGQLAHGWARPHFELAEALRLAADIHARFDPELNIFRNRRGNVLETWKAVEVKTDDGKRLKVFPFGAGLWRWRKIEATVPHHI